MCTGRTSESGRANAALLPHTDRQGNEMKVIRTKYIGPTSVKGSRVSASTGETGQRIILDWPYELNPTKAHAKAARALCTKLGWDGPNYELVGGGFPDGTMVWVFTCSDRA